MDEQSEQAGPEISATPPIFARPIPHYPYPSVSPIRRFPSIGMTRRQAVADLFIVFVAFVVGLSTLGGVSQWLMEMFPSLGILLSNVVLGAISLTSIAIVLYARHQSPASLGLGKPPLGRTLLGTLAAIPACYILVASAVMIYFSITKVDAAAMVQERSDFFEIIPDLSLGSILAFTLFVGLHEEILFRGFILTRLSALFRSPLAAILVSSVIFGLIHGLQGPVGVIQTGVVGLVLAVLVTLTRSLWPAILTHMVFDTISLTVLPLIRDRLPEFIDQLTTTQAAAFFLIR